MFVKIGIASDMAPKFSEILIAYAQQHGTHPQIHSILYIAQSLWVVWYRSKFWAGQTNRQSEVVMCKAWALLCLHILTEKLTGDPHNQELKDLFHCFASSRELEPLELQ